MLEFDLQNQKMITKMKESKLLNEVSLNWIKETVPFEYSYHFKWMGRPIIQYPQDIIAMQEIIWDVKPDLIIETGIAHGGSIIFYSSMLELIGNGDVIGIDIDIRKHNREFVENHPMYKRITLIEGSSISKEVAEQVKKIAYTKKNIMVILDSNHTHEHVMQELELYSPLVTKNNYLVVFDTIVEDMPEKFFHNRPWGKGNNPKTAVQEFLKTHSEFEIDKNIQSKLLITVAPEGYLRKKC